MVIIIVHQCTTIHNDEHSTTLQPHNNVTNEHHQPKPKPIKCGIEYLNETIGLSITNNHLYQFLFIDNMIQIIQYDYQKLLENIDENDDYKLNLIDGQMLANGLEDLEIPKYIVEQLMTVIDWIDEEEELNMYDYSDESPIISMAIADKMG
mgnify:CR=1 FL=1